MIAGFTQGISELLLAKCDSMTADGTVPKAACPFYLLTKLLKTIIDTAAGLVPVFGFLAAVGVVIAAPLLIHIKLKNAFGIGLFGYLGLFPKGSAIFAVIYGILAIATVALTLLSLGVNLNDAAESESTAAS